MKSLAICSNDFYSNIPDWLSSYETPSFVSNFNSFNSLISTMINNRNTMDAEYIGDNILNNAVPLPNPSNNFLLYYYVEYM